MSLDKYYADSRVTAVHHCAILVNGMLIQGDPRSLVAIRQQRSTLTSDDLLLVRLLTSQSAGGFL